MIGLNDLTPPLNAIETLTDSSTLSLSVTGSYWAVGIRSEPIVTSRDWPRTTPSAGAAGTIPLVL